MTHEIERLYFAINIYLAMKFELLIGGIERRKIIFSSIGIVAAAFCNASKDEPALASQFADSEKFPFSEICYCNILLCQIFFTAL